MAIKAKKGKGKNVAVKKLAKPAAKKAKVVVKKAKPIKKAAPAKVKKIIKKAVTKKVAPKKAVKKIIVKKKPTANKTKHKVVKKVAAKKTVVKKVISKKKPVTQKAAVKKPAAKAAKVVKPIAKPIAKAATKSVAKPVVVKTTPVKPTKPIRPIRKGPPIAIPAMNHKTIAEKIEERKAAPMKLQVSQINLGVVGRPVSSIPPYRVSPGEEYMNNKQEKHFLDILQAWKRQLMEGVDKTISHLKDDAENYADLNDRATQEEEFTLELKRGDRERKLLNKIDETIVLIENGDFGYCEACGVEIGLPRLEVRPTATQCIDCKTVEEIREKQLTL
jgi:DnaK suppressor protein